MSSFSVNDSENEIFLDELFSQDLAPQINFQSELEVNTATTFSTFSSYQSDSQFIDLDSELEKILNEEMHDPCFSSTADQLTDFDFELADFNNNLTQGQDESSKAESNILDSLSKTTTQEEDLRVKVEEDLRVKVEEDHPYCVAGSQAEYIRHLQPMPDITSPTPRMISKQQSIPPYSAENEVTFMGRKIVTHNPKAMHSPGAVKRHHLQRMQSQVMGIQKISSYTTSKFSPYGLAGLKHARILPSRRSEDRERLSKMRKGVSILKPVPSKPAACTATQPNINITAAEVRNGRCQFSGVFNLSGGWVTKEDPVKEMKNKQERIRRGELAKYREKVKNMLPHIRELDKVATVTILDMARQYCLQLQQMVMEAEYEMRVEYDWNNFLRKKLEELESESDHAYLMMNTTGTEEKIAIDKFFESFGESCYSQELVPRN